MSKRKEQIQLKPKIMTYMILPFAWYLMLGSCVLLLILPMIEYKTVLLEEQQFNEHIKQITVYELHTDDILEIENEIYIIADRVPDNIKDAAIMQQIDDVFVIRLDRFYEEYHLYYEGNTAKLLRVAGMDKEKQRIELKKHQAKKNRYGGIAYIAIVAVFSLVIYSGKEK